MASEGMNALGAIETFGLVWVLEAGDAMCKAGDVELIGYENTASGYISILVQGDVAACKAASRRSARRSTAPSSSQGLTPISRRSPTSTPSRSSCPTREVSNVSHR